MAGLGEKFSQHAKGVGAALGSGAGVNAKTVPFPGATDQRPILTEISISQIETDPEQPRRDLGDLSELAASIRELGIIQPVIVSVIGYERYRIVAGERRFTAAGKAGLSKIPAIVRSAEEHRKLEIQLVENLHRKDLNPFEEALSYRRLLAEFNLSHEELGRRLGKTQVSVTETLQILNLPEQVQQEATEKEGNGARISKSLLLEISRRPRTEQLRLWESAKRGELTVKKVRLERDVGVRQTQTRNRRSNRLERFHYPIALVVNPASVTVEFAEASPRIEDVVAALEEALDLERAKMATI